MKLIDCIKKAPHPSRHAVLSREAWGEDLRKRVVLIDIRDFNPEAKDFGSILFRAATMEPEDAEATDWYIVTQ